MHVANALKDLYKSDSVEKHLILDFYHKGEEAPFLSLEDTHYFPGQLMKIKESLSSSENIDFGSCEASQFEITLQGVEDDLEGAHLVAYQTIKGLFPADDLYPSEDLFPDGYSMPLGRYIVQSADKQTNRRYRDLVALDYMTLFDTDVIDWYNALRFPLTLREFRASLCRYIGVTESVPDHLPNDDMLVEKTIDAIKLNGRDVLVACEQINGTFGHFDRNGVLQHIVLDPNCELLPAEDLYPSDNLFPGSIDEATSNIFDETMEPYLCISCKHEEYTVQPIDKVRICQEEGDIGAIYGNGDNCYTLEGNYLVFGKSAAELEQIAIGVYGRISGRKYIPYEYNGKGLPYVEVGNSILIRPDNVSTYIMKRTLSGIFALKDNYSATGEEVRSMEAHDINTEIIQLKGKSAILKRTVEEVSATVTNLENQTSAQFKILSDQITSEVTRAKGTESELSSRITQTAERIEFKVSKGEVSSQISVESGQVYIGGNRLVVDSTNFKLDSNGNANYSGNVTGASITGSTISGGSFYTDRDETRFGVFTVTSDEEYCMYSDDGSFILETASAPSGSVARMVLGDGNGVNVTEIEGGNITSTGIIRAGTFYDTGKSIHQFYDIRPGKGWWNGWTISQTVHKLWDMVFRLARIIDNQWDDYEGVEDALDDWDSSNNDPTEW